VQAIIITSVVAFFLLLTFAAWLRYRGVASGKLGRAKTDACPYSVTEVFGDDHLLNVPHQKGVLWLTEVFSRSAKKFPDQIALQIPHTGESFTYAELDSRAENIAAEIARYLSGPDQVVAVDMPEYCW
jgi:non-ribosomal peptide synthetase component F